MRCLLGLSREELAVWLEEQGEKPFRAGQIFDWIFQKRAQDFSEMTNLSKELRDKLSAAFVVQPLTVVRRSDSEDLETSKFLFRLPDGKMIESVLISSDERRTVCVSSQVGCGARCAFCASGKRGLMRNLEAAEILAQVFLIDRFLKEKGERVTHIVFMGMGEPFDNYENVKKAIQTLISPLYFALSQRRITVSTVGVIEGIERLMEESFTINLVFSLHAPNDHLRKKLIPYARKYTLQEIFSSLDRYFAKTKREITFEYTLISGMNDQREHAEELVRLLQGKQCTINLIPYNPVQGLRLKRPKKEAIYEFIAILEEGKINTTWRYTKGKDINAACGQLALQEEESLT